MVNYRVVAVANARNYVLFVEANVIWREIFNELRFQRV